MTDGALFREEVAGRFQTGPWQPPILSRPVSGYLLLLLVGIASAALIGFAVSFEFARKEQARGHLAPVGGWARVTARFFAVVGSRMVDAGVEVKTGDVLFELAPPDGLGEGLTVEEKLVDEIEGRREALETELRLIDSQYENDQKRLRHEGDFLRSDLVRVKKEIDLHASRLAIARQRHDDARRLQEAGALSSTDLMLLLDDVRSRELPLSEKRGAAQHLRSSLVDMEDRLEQLRLDADLRRAGVREQIHALAMEESRIRGAGAARVLAPRDGVVASVRVRAGDRVQPGQTLLDILPDDGRLLARLFAPSTAMGMVEVGQDVRVYLDAFPHERHGAQAGRVSAVSESTLAPGEAPFGHDPALPLFQVDVAFPNGFDLTPEQVGALRPGMTVTADLVRDRRTLVDWVLEPVRGTVGRL